MNTPINWLLEGESYVAYRTRLDLLGQTEDVPSVQAARQGMLVDPNIQAIIKELSVWPWKVISSHKSAGQAFHKLTFLADLGIRANDPGMDGIIGPILDHQAEEGPFQLPDKCSNTFRWCRDGPVGMGTLRYPFASLCIYKDGACNRTPPYKKQPDTWQDWYGKTAGRAPSRKSWANSADLGGKKTPAHSRHWQCSRHLP